MNDFTKQTNKQTFFLEKEKRRNSSVAKLFVLSAPNNYLS